MIFKVFALGCKVNFYEINALSYKLLEKGYKEASDNDIPDIVIINTCSVTAVADQKSRQHIRKFQKLYPNAIIAVMGCYSQGNAEFIFNEIKPQIVIGTDNRDKLISYIEKYISTKERTLDISKDVRKLDYEDFGITSYTDNVRAYLKIQDGCDNFCTYCVIPYRRGKARSRKFENVIKEAEFLVSSGYKEIILTGIHVGMYGKDLLNTTFSDLVESVLNIPNLKRLTISSIEESEFDDKLINLFKEKNNLAKHAHIPLQSGSDTVLKRMGRRYNTKQFKTKIEMLKKASPDIAFTTDVIVGFPGETEEEFMETYNFIKEVEFNQLHVFPYSARPGTPASKMADQIPSEIKKQRCQKLLDLSKELWDQYCAKFINKELEIIIEQIKDGFYFGHSTNYIEVKIPHKNEKIGDLVTVKLQKSMIYSE